MRPFFGRTLLTPMCKKNIRKNLTSHTVIHQSAPTRCIAFPMLRRSVSKPLQTRAVKSIRAINTSRSDSGREEFSLILAMCIFAVASQTAGYSAALRTGCTRTKLTAKARAQLTLTSSQTAWRAYHNFNTLTQFVCDVRAAYKL